MNTPICDFVREYSKKNPLRLHMPGHKGEPFLGCEKYDITEIPGADSLYEADGIIAESEESASRLFGCKTYYSTEGSSHCIRAMLYLAMLHAKAQGKRMKVAAARNAHKVFLSGAAMLDLDVTWLYPDEGENYLSCDVSAGTVERFLKEQGGEITALYLTSPDYLGNIAQIREISEVCRKYHVLLLVDNAHGAYLKFLPESLHPIDLGADICCDSAHKTLPVLTGGAYLHISPSVFGTVGEWARGALAMFGSTSPSYLILQSLDRANRYISEGYPDRLSVFCADVSRCKEILCEHGYVFLGDEPLKLTIKAKEYGYRGTELAEILEKEGIVCEFADVNYTVLMMTPEISSDALERVKRTLISIPKRARIEEKPPILERMERVMTIREAMLSPSESLPSSECEGRVLASASVGCPPAVPIVVSGERIDRRAVECFEYYGIEKVSVVRDTRQ